VAKFEFGISETDDNINHMEVLERNQEPLDVANECNDLLNTVEYHCSQCEAVYEDMAILNKKIQAIYDAVVAKTRGNRDLVAVQKNWIAAYIVAGGIRQAVCVKKQMHQICGIDSNIVDEVFGAIKERLEFLRGFPLEACE
jgi:hypothetical protein